ncbi:hypothetical protein [Candidatus Palauibacter sp.]|uniref:hypothetical protein n=1 Tax=Candidatus Palauibacter sp. TaxID=3101350 RepID=UPI003AF2B6E3
MTLTGSLLPVTDASSDVQNEPAGQWMPAIYETSAITDSGQRTYGEEEAWADLAASARADWASENPF